MNEVNVSLDLIFRMIGEREVQIQLLRTELANAKQMLDVGKMEKKENPDAPDQQDYSPS